MSGDLGSRAVRGVAWLGSGQLFRQVLAFATNIALARMLFPDDFGLFGMAFAAAEIAQILTDFGLGAAIIQRRETSPVVLTTCFWLNLGVGVTVSLLLLALSPWISTYFLRPELTWLLVPLGVNMIIAAAIVVPQALLTQQLKFREITTAQTLGSIVASVGTISLAAAGAGVWSLVLQPVIGNVIACTAMYRLSRWWPTGRFNFSAVRDMMSFSGHLLGNSLLSCIGRNLHAGILGRLLGSSALGMYNLASGVTGTVVFQVSSVIVRVLFPTLANLRDEPQRIQSAWFKACSAIAIAAFPAMAGVIAVAADLVPVVFGSQWIPMIDVLRILCGVMALQSVLTTSGTVLMAMGRADTLFRTSIASVIMIGIGLWVGSQYGLTGAATGYAFGALSTSTLITILACREVNIRFRDLVAELIPWMMCSILMAVIVVALAGALEQISAPIRLGLCIVSGVFFYSALLWLFVRTSTLALINDIFPRLFGPRHRRVVP